MPFDPSTSASGWLPILPDFYASRRRNQQDSATWTEPSPAGYTPAPDILASLAFFPSLPQPTPRVRRAQPEIVIVEPFDTPTVIDPLAWLPISSGPSQRSRRARQEVDVIDPTAGEAMKIAARMGWAPRLPAAARIPRARQEAVEVWDPLLFGYLGCLELVDTASTITDLTIEALPITDLLAETATITDLITEALC